MKLKKNIFLILNIIIPLLAGLGIYVFMKDTTYINDFLGLSFNYVPKTFIGTFIVNWFCDFLWSYAFVFTLYLVLEPFSKRIIISPVITVIVGTALELMQKSGTLTGTFDWWDIAVELVAVLVAVAVLKIRKTSKS